MNFLGWNYRGLENSRTVRALNDLVRDRNPDILFLSETISVANIIEKLRVKFKYVQCFSIDRVGRSGVLTVFWRSIVDVFIDSYSQNHIDLVFNENGATSWSLTLYYGFLERTRRREAWDMICRLSKASSLPWCILGDFNDLLYSSDNQGIHPHPGSLIEGFRKALEESMLSEIDLEGGLFTWEEGKGSNDWVQERLDRVFATREWWLKFPLCKLSVITDPVSDHEPIFMEFTETTITKRKFRFKFENTWLKEPSFIRDVTDQWEKVHCSNLIPKLISVSKYMGKWGRNFFNKFKEKVRRQKEILDDLKNKSYDNSVR
ncbi:uncharacterized protein LOC141686140 [Apium graveolens]|uniref:uncharacterized protein LOC141686140 n=1 Tax=Apium graveolens TaxID=4045 RepID=UPI003D795F47